MPTKGSSKATNQPPQKNGREPAIKTKGHAKYTEDDMVKALYACSDSNPHAVSIAKAAKEYGIPQATLSARKRGNKPRKEAHTSQQRLTPKEEEALAMYCQSKGWRGEPLGVADIREVASKICGEKVGVNWVYGFTKRHPELRMRWAKAGESKRASGLNRVNVESFYECLAKAREGVDADCIWNCDEKGLVENGGTVRTRVIVGSDQRDPKVTADESRKMVTIIECVNAVGGAISPLVIHEGAEKDAEWIRSNPCGAQ
jgi:hypothetical protein